MGWPKSSLRLLLEFWPTNKKAMLNFSINDISGHSLPPFLISLSSLISQILCFVFNWRIIALQYCGSLCHTSKQISHNYLYVCISSLLTLSPHPSPLGRHRVPSWAPCVMQQLPASDLSYTWWCVCVKATFSTRPTLSF